MFNKEELLLLLFQRKQVIDPGADGDENASEESFRADFTAKMSSRVEKDRIFARDKIEEILAAYEGKELNAWDKKLIHGIYHKGQKNYRHLKKVEDMQFTQEEEEDWSVVLTISSEKSDDAQSYVTSDDDILDGSINNELTIRMLSKRTLNIK